MIVKSKFKFGQKVNHVLSGEEFIISSIQIFTDKSINYGCISHDTNWKWFKEYELKPKYKSKKIGFGVTIDKLE